MKRLVDETVSPRNISLMILAWQKTSNESHIRYSASVWP